MNENDMLNELLTYAAYDTEKVIEYWNAMDYDQRIVAYTLYTSEWNYEALECVEIAYDGDYALYSEQCKTLADVAREEFECFDADTMIRCLNDVGGWESYVDWDLANQYYEYFDEELLRHELWQGHLEFIDWDAVGGAKDSVHNMIYSDVTGRWVEVN